MAAKTILQEMMGLLLIVILAAGIAVPVVWLLEPLVEERERRSELFEQKQRMKLIHDIRNTNQKNGANDE